MPVYNQPLASFNSGYLGAYMKGRSDLKPYLSGALDLNNCFVLPHGGILRRRGLANLYEFTGIDPSVFSQSYLMTYSFNRDQEYVLVFAPNSTIYIFRNRQLKATIPHPYAGADIRAVKYSTQLDSIILTHPSYPPKKLFRQGSDSAWGIGDIAFINFPFFRYNVNQTLTPTVLTANAATVLNLSGTNAYFTAAYAQGVMIKPDPTLAGVVTTSGFPNAATGGTALASAGTAANAFDSSAATTCNAGVNGWIGYKTAAAGGAVFAILGINANTTVTANLILETAADDAFTTTVATVGTFTGVVLTAGTITWLDIPGYAANQRLRVRVTNGVVLDVKDVYFASGLSVSGTVGSTAIASATASKAWQEQMWSPAKGYPGCSTFFADRLVFAGIRDVPNALVASNTGDYFNFDDVIPTGQTGDAKTYKFIANSSSNQTIYNILPNRSGLVVFASDGEFSASTADNAAATPSKPLTCYQQTYIGSANIVIESVMGQVLFISQDRKTVNSFSYSFADDNYQAVNCNIYSHDMFIDLLQLLELPRRLAVLPNYRDTQSMVLFVPCTNGICATMTFDPLNSLRAWATWNTPNGSFLDVCVAHSLNDASVGVVAEPYFLVRRTINGVDRLFLEVHENQRDVYLDHWEQADTGGVPSAGPFTFTEGVANTDISVSVADSDGLAVIGDFTTGNDGTFTLPDPVINPFAGFRYDTRIETMPIAPELASISLKGRPVMLKEAIITFDGTLAATVNGRRPAFRNYDKDLFDTTISLKSGIAKIAISNNWGQVYDPTIVIETDAPVPMNVLNLTVKYKCGV